MRQIWLIIIHICIVFAYIAFTQTYTPVDRLLCTQFNYVHSAAFGRRWQHRLPKTAKTPIHVFGILCLSQSRKMTSVVA